MKNVGNSSRGLLFSLHHVYGALRGHLCDSTTFLLVIAVKMNKSDVDRFCLFVFVKVIANGYPLFGTPCRGLYILLL